MLRVQTSTRVRPSHISNNRIDKLIRVLYFPVVRSAYEDPFYCNLAREAIQQWKDKSIWGDTYHESVPPYLLFPTSPLIPNQIRFRNHRFRRITLRRRFLSKRHRCRSSSQETKINRRNHIDFPSFHPSRRIHPPSSAPQQRWRMGISCGWCSAVYRPSYQVRWEDHSREDCESCY